MPLDEQLYPVNLRIAGHRCLVVGAGAVAEQKIAELVYCGAEVLVVAIDVTSALRSRVAAEWAGTVTISQRPYEAGDLAEMRLAIAATGDSVLNATILADGRRVGVLVNSADDPQNCDFTLPSRVRRGPVLLTAATGGHSPALSVWLRRLLEREIGPEYEVLLEVLAEARADLRSGGIPTEGLDWQGALDSGMLELIREGRVREAKERLQACLSSSSE